MNKNTYFRGFSLFWMNSRSYTLCVCVLLAAPVRLSAERVGHAEHRSCQRREPASMLSDTQQALWWFPFSRRLAGIGGGRGNATSLVTKTQLGLNWKYRIFLYDNYLNDGESSIKTCSIMRLHRDGDTAGHSVLSGRLLQRR